MADELEKRLMADLESQTKQVTSGTAAPNGQAPKPANPEDLIPKRRNYNLIGIIREELIRRKLEHENRLLRREELMKQDIERFLMECEERHSWCAYELNRRNYERLLRLEEIAKIQAHEKMKDDREQENNIQENGLFYFRGLITSNRRWQNSPAKHLDMKGHLGPVFSCKLSKCVKYVISCSGDNTARIWNLKNGKCLMVYEGHKKRVTDCDIHPNFEMGIKSLCVVTSSGDRTMRLWNTDSERSLKVLRGHGEAIYRCSFSPDGEKKYDCECF